MILHATRHANRDWILHVLLFSPVRRVSSRMVEATEIVTVPRWFLIVIAACAVVATASIAYRTVRPTDDWASWSPDESGVSWFINRRTHQLCFTSQRGSTCYDPLKNPLH